MEIAVTFLPIPISAGRLYLFLFAPCTASVPDFIAYLLLNFSKFLHYPSLLALLVLFAKFLFEPLQLVYSHIPVFGVHRRPDYAYIFSLGQAGIHSA